MRDCLDYAMDYIYRFPKTEKELRIQLIKKGYHEDTIDDTLLTLKEKGYVDDKIFAKLYIQSELVSKGKPRMIITQKLMFKGVDKQIIKDTMEELESEATEGVNERIRKEIDKLKNQGLEGVELIQKLLRRGYKLDEVKNCLKKS